MQMTVYDLLGALFAPSDPWPVSRHADKLFARIRGIINYGLPIQISAHARWQPKRGSRCDTRRNSLPSATLPAVISSIRFAWTTPHAF
jgi:hypothetical protein